MPGAGVSVWRRWVPWAMFLVGLPLFAWQWALEFERGGSMAMLLFGGLALLLLGFVWLTLRLAHRLQSRPVQE